MFIYLFVFVMLLHSTIKSLEITIHSLEHFIYLHLNCLILTEFIQSRLNQSYLLSINWDQLDLIAERSAVGKDFANRKTLWTGLEFQQHTIQIEISRLWNKKGKSQMSGWCSSDVASVGKAKDRKSKKKKKPRSQNQLKRNRFPNLLTWNSSQRVFLLDCKPSNYFW